MFPFHSAGLGVEGVFARRCPTDRSREQLRDCHMTVPLVSSAEGVVFGGVASFRVAGVALRYTQMCFVWVESHFVGQAQYFCNVFKRCVAFFLAGATLWGPSS